MYAIGDILHKNALVLDFLDTKIMELTHAKNVTTGIDKVRKKNNHAIGSSADFGVSNIIAPATRNANPTGTIAITYIVFNIIAIILNNLSLILFII